MLHFQSEAFTDPLGADAETNPGIFGKALANWLSQQLTSQGSTAGEVIAEDFGWCVPLKPNLFVACASGEEAPNQWQVFVFAEGGLLSRLFGRDQATQAVATAFAAVKSVLQHSIQVRGLREEPV